MLNSNIWFVIKVCGIICDFHSYWAGEVKNRVWQCSLAVPFPCSFYWTLESTRDGVCLETQTAPVHTCKSPEVTSSSAPNPMKGLPVQKSCPCYWERCETGEPQIIAQGNLVACIADFLLRNGILHPIWLH